jgi:predicted membrane-bound spermidine synthase
MDNATAAFLGDWFGAIVGGVLWGYLFLRRLEPDERALMAVICAWILVSVVAGFGLARGGPFEVTAGLRYLPGAVIAFFMLRSRYWKLWSDDEDEFGKEESEK